VKTFLLTMAVLFVLGALSTINTKPGEPRKPHGSARQLMVTLAIELGLAVWALSLWWCL
jgi:hypothetical protein